VSKQVRENTGRLRMTPDWFSGGRNVDASHASSVERFIDALNWLRLEVGNPSLRQLAELSGSQFSKNTLDDHLSHRRVRLPPWGLVAAYVTACHKAATLTGLEAGGLGTLKEWHERYLAALTGDIGVSDPFATQVIPKDGDASVKPSPGRKERATTGLKIPSRVGSADGQVHGSSNASRDAFGVPSVNYSSGPVAFDDVANKESDDEVDVAAQGEGRWSVRWLPRKPLSEGAAKRAAVRDEESTESLSSSSEAFFEIPADLAVSLAVDTALLIIKRGLYAGSQFLIHQDRTTIGRDPACDVYLDNVTVSRVHSVIYKKSGHFSVRDAGSLNGTYINREAVTEGLLASGDELQIGVFRFLFLQGY
jgi:FHA domain